MAVKRKAVRSPEVTKRDRLAAELKALKTPEGLSPERVVAWAAAHKRSVLHGEFNWDDSAAAHQYRLWQARQIIVNVTVVHDDGVARQVFVSPIQTRGGKGGYQQLTEVLGSEDMRALFLAQALEELERVCERYADLCELAGVRAAVRLVRQSKAA